MKLEFFSTGFRKILDTKFHKIRPVATGVFHADGHTGRLDQVSRIVALSQLEKAPKMLSGFKKFYQKIKNPDKSSRSL
jgi:hypothetical protein